MNNRNITLFYFLESLLSLLRAIILPVYVLYFRHYDLTLFQVALLAAVFEAAVLLFEIPTGIFADKYGRRLSTIIGFSLFAISGAVFCIWRDFAGFIVAEVIFGLAETFISGALEALAVDSLDELQREKYLARLFSNRTILRTGTMVVGMVVGGIIAQSYLQYIFVPIIFLGLGAPISLFLKEHKESESRISADGKTLGIRGIAKIISNNRLVLALFCVGLMANLACEGADQFWQVLFSEIRGIDMSYYGIMTAAGALLVLLFAKTTEKFYDRLGIYLFASFSLMAVSLVVSAGLANDPAVVGIIFYFAAKEIYRPVISYHINRNIGASNRATVLSGYNLTCSIGEVLAGVGVGMLAGKFGVPAVFYFSAAVALGVPIIFAALSSKKMSVSR